MINIFIPIYLFSLGFPIYQILIFYFLEALYFIIFAYKGAQITSRIGAKHSILLSGPFFALYILGLAGLNHYPVLFFLIPLFASLRAVLFIYGFDLIFLKNSEENRIGRELAALYILILLAGAIAPFLGGLLSEINFNLAFITSLVFVIGGSIPLLFTKDNKDIINFNFSKVVKKIFSKRNIGNSISFSGYAVEATIDRVIWPIFIIFIVGTLEKTGLLISLSILISIFVFYFVGKITDKVNKISLLKLGTILYYFGWIGRIFANTSGKILFVDSYKNISEEILKVPWVAQTYALAKREDRFEFIVFRQVVFNSIRIIVLPILIALFYFDIYPFILSFAIASIFSLGYLFINK